MRARALSSTIARTTAHRSRTHFTSECDALLACFSQGDDTGAGAPEVGRSVAWRTRGDGRRVPQASRCDRLRSSAGDAPHTSKRSIRIESLLPRDVVRPLCWEERCPASVRSCASARPRRARVIRVTRPLPRPAAKDAEIRGDEDWFGAIDAHLGSGGMRLDRGWAAGECWHARPSAPGSP